MKRRGSRVLVLRITDPKALELIDREVKRVKRQYGGSPAPSRIVERLIVEAPDRKDGDQ